MGSRDLLSKPTALRTSVAFSGPHRPQMKMRGRQKTVGQLETEGPGELGTGSADIHREWMSNETSPRRGWRTLGAEGNGGVPKQVAPGCNLTAQLGLPCHRGGLW